MGAARLSDALAVEASGLVKEYKSFRSTLRALDGVDISVRRGEIYGLLGPNGAGKTTFVKCVLGLLRPNSGTVSLLGQPASNPSARARVGFAPELPNFAPYLSAIEIMRIHSALIGMPKDKAASQYKSLLERAELQSAPRRIKVFSKGMLRRLALAQAALGDPELLVLDEPTADLDPLGRRDVRNQLLEFKARGATVLLNSHLLSEIERVCDRVAILNKGKVIASGTLDDLIPQGSDLETVFVDLIEKARGE